MAHRLPALTVLLAAAVLLLAGCEGEEEGSATMRPGQACLDCHDGGRAPRFTLAGTVYSDTSGSTGVSGAVVTITDGSGAEVTATTNSAGNFHTSSPITFPADVSITLGSDTVTMPAPATTGNCNSCHGGDGGSAIHVP